MKIENLKKHILELIIIIFIIIAACTSSSFLTLPNLLNILRSYSMVGIIAFGMTFTIIGGEMDLSVGSTVAFSGIVAAKVAGELSSNGVMSLEAGMVLGMVAALVLSGICGLLNGFLLVKFKMPSFIITLGMLNILYGLSAVICGGFPVTTCPDWYNVLGAGKLLGIIPVPAIFLIAIFVVTFIVLKFTYFGRAVYAVGGNAEAARLSGIKVGNIKIAIMIIVQICAAFAGMLLSSQTLSANFTFGRGWEMNVISSVIIGGASLSGGKGHAWGTLMGVLFLGVLNNAMTLWGVDDYVKYIVQGALVIGAVLMNVIIYKKKD